MIRGCALATVLGALALPQAAAAEALVGVSEKGDLVQFRSERPEFVEVREIGGLAAGVRIAGLDVRPATGRVHALGTDSRLYTLDLATAAATATGTGPFSPALRGSFFGFDFNPVVDRIRLVSNEDQNLRLHPGTGAVAANDGTLAYDGADPGAGQNPNVVGSAYTNNFAGTSTTQLFGIDSARDVVVLQNPPNAGTLRTVGALGVDATDATGFDIAFTDGTAWAALRTGASGSSTLHRIDVATGKATAVGRIGGPDGLVGLAAVGPGLADDKKPGVSVAVTASRRVSTLASKGVRAAVTITEGATLSAQLLDGTRRIAQAGESADLRSTVTLRLTPSSAAARRLAARDSVRLKLRITVTDGSGNVTVVQRVIKAS